MTKNPNRDDDEGDSDMLEVTHEYKTPDSSATERLSIFNACRGFSRAQQYYEFPNRETEDVFFDLVDIDIVPFGQPFDVVVNIHVSVLLIIASPKDFRVQLSSRYKYRILCTNYC